MRTVVLSRAQVWRGPLILVNRDHPLRCPYPLDPVPALPSCPDVLLDRQAAGLLGACVRAAGGAEEIVPVSGWRSLEEQRRIWDGSLAGHGETFTRRYVALPGCSEHQTGLAIDLGRRAKHIDFLRPDFPNRGACGAFRRLAARYGFIQRYRREKEALTGIAREPWHFRYVGPPHAQLMVRHRLALEEYASFLRREGPCSCTLPNGRAAQVFYVPCEGEETALELPDGCCQVSGDNDGGFLVTVWGVPA